MNQQRHIIKKQILELELSSKEGTFELQNQVSKIYHEKIVPLIDYYCSQLSSPDVINKINRLELDIGKININNLEQDLIQTVETQIKQQLTKKINSNQLSLSTSLRSPFNTDSNSQERSHSNTSDLEMIGYFIQTGILPWWSKKLSKQELEKSFEQLIKTSPEQVTSLLNDFFKNENYLRRIIYHFSDSTLIKITNLFSPKLSQFVANYNKEILDILSQLDDFQRISLAKFRFEQWRGIFLNFTFNQNIQFEVSQFIKENILHLATSFHIDYIFLVNNIIQILDRLKKENQTTFKNQLLETLSEIQERIEEIDTSRNNLLTRLQPRNHILDLGNRFNNADEIYINNSGLILLWPFFKRLFEKIELVQKNSFTNTNSAQKAVLVLQYLVDSTTEIAESNLPLNKLLCGIDIFQPIETSLDITEAEIVECETLLAAAITKWAVLKNTSITGFRKTFLQREGILRIRHGSWLLQVERQTHDILLDKIPWSIKVIKLPWINRILYVEW